MKIARILVDFFGNFIVSFLACMFMKHCIKQQVENLSSLTKKSRAEGSTLCLHLKTKQRVSRKLFCMTNFCFVLKLNDLQLRLIISKVHHRLAVFGLIFLAFECVEYVNMAT